MTPNKMIHMLDTETTSLSAKNGVMREVAIVSLSFDRRGTVIKKSEFQINLSTVPSWWDDDTLTFTLTAHRIDPKHSMEALSILEESTVRLAVAQREEAMRKFSEYLQEQTKGKLKPAQHLWIFNHPEFDIPFLEKEGLDFRKLVGHSNIFDMRSLLFGAGFNKYQCYAFGEEARTLNREGVYHTALGDCYIQLDTLYLAGLLTKLALA